MCLRHYAIIDIQAIIAKAVTTDSSSLQDTATTETMPWTTARTATLNATVPCGAHRITLGDDRTCALRQRQRAFEHLDVPNLRASTNNRLALINGVGRAEHLFESLGSGARVQALSLRSFKDLGAPIDQERERSPVGLGALELGEVLGGSTEQG